MRKKKLAILGAGEFQNPLILKARSMGCETHVFAWECGDIGEKTADFFYPISTADKDKILDRCRSIGIDGVCTIGSDFNNIASTYIANKLGLCANSNECVAQSTNKRLMREAFARHEDPSPKSIEVIEGSSLPPLLDELSYPAIVKPTDRSGSRGITRVDNYSQMADALHTAFKVSWEHRALVEEYLEGEEFSVEFCSWEGKHHFLQMTRKFTTGAPNYIETGHIEPAMVDKDTSLRTQAVVSHALDSLGVEYGASHSEVKINAKGEPWLVEIGSRMGGDCIGSDLVELSSGIDFLAAVINVALGEEPDLSPHHEARASGIRFIFTKQDITAYEKVKSDNPEIFVRGSNIVPLDHAITDSSNRDGFFIMCAPAVEKILKYMPVSSDPVLS